MVASWLRVLSLLAALVDAQRGVIDPNAIRPRPPGFGGAGLGPSLPLTSPMRGGPIRPGAFQNPGFGFQNPSFQQQQTRPQFPTEQFPQPRPQPARPQPPPARPQPARPLPPPGTSTAPPRQQRCTSFKIRKEWRTLTEQEQLNYVAALRCMIKLPTKAAAVMKPPGLVSRFDDFSFTHITLADKVHYVGQFLPWHRYFLNLFEEALRTDCGYQGTQPYWDWNLDTVNFANSPIFDPVKGFGGNGVFKALPKDYKPDPGRRHLHKFLREMAEKKDDPWATPRKPKKINEPPSDSQPGPEASNGPANGGLPNNWQEAPVTNSTPTDTSHTGGGCVQSGLFVGNNITLGMGDTLEMNPRCLVRDFMPQFAAQSASTKNIRMVLSQPTYGDMFSNLDVLHEAGHGGVGGYLGDMANLYSSSVDPLFYLHHANLDRFWWSWQALDLPKRLVDMSGPTTYHGPVNVSLSFPLEMGVSGKQVLVRDVMDTRLSPWCVAYDRVYTL